MSVLQTLPFLYSSLLSSILRPPKHFLSYCRRTNENFPLTLVCRNARTPFMYTRRKNNWTASVREVFARCTETEYARVSREIYRNRT